MGNRKGRAGREEVACAKTQKMMCDLSVDGYGWSKEFRLAGQES